MTPSLHHHDHSHFPSTSLLNLDSCPSESTTHVWHFLLSSQERQVCGFRFNSKITNQITKRMQRESSSFAYSFIVVKSVERF